MRRYWKVMCMEENYPGLWHTWFIKQVAAVGWRGAGGYLLDGSGPSNDRGWTMTRKGLQRMQPGDLIVVQLRKNRVGRIGEVVRLAVGDTEWDPTVPRSRQQSHGEHGRVIHVRWDLETSPPTPDVVVELPKKARLSRGKVRSTLAELDRRPFKTIQNALKDEKNWVSVLPEFRYERYLSDYIASFPHRLEAGLRPFPSLKVREQVFPDRTRSDVLLIDRSDLPVVVECKQGAPDWKAVRQLRGYMKNAEAATENTPRGILVHGGSRKLSEKVREAALRKPAVEVVQYDLSVGFRSSL